MKKEATVVLTRYKENNSLILPCLEGLANQKNVSINVFFLDQKKDFKLKKYLVNLSNKNARFVYKNIPIKSLSYARNKGIALANTDIVLFIDSDAIPKQNWAFHLIRVLNKDKIAVVGGRSEPKWLKKPKWYNKSKIVGDIYSLINLGNGDFKTTKIVGVNFGINKKVLRNEAYFNESLGRRPGSLLGGEESDLCKRALNKDFLIYYTSKSLVDHQIQKERMSIYWIIKRFYYGGLGRGLMRGVPKTYNSKKDIKDILILPFILGPYLVGYLRGRLNV